MDSDPSKAMVSSEIETLFQSTRDTPGQFPDPITVLPLLDHRQTFILLHGRGSTASKFGPPLLATMTPSGETVQTAFPHAKLIFLTASLNRATIYKKSYTHQWFDNWHLEEYTKRQDLQRPGLAKSCNYLHSILRQEIAIIDAKNVLLWGLSQGCATSLISLLTWDGEPIAAAVGMCGFLPFSNHIEEIALGYQSNLLGDPFSEDLDDGVLGDESKVSQDPIQEALAFLKDELDMDTGEGMAFQKVPIFLGHGNQDEKVGIKLGREAKACLELLGVNVQMTEYEGLQHWYSPEMLAHIFQFLEQSLGIDRIMV